MKSIISLGLVLFLAGCTGANISSQVRESGNPGSNMMTRCVNYSTGSDDNTNEILQKYDGWKLIYISEYTTDNKTDTAAVMCFEKPVS
jgi:hypothetical protein